MVTTTAEPLAAVEIPRIAVVLTACRPADSALIPEDVVTHRRAKTRGTAAERERATGGNRGIQLGVDCDGQRRPRLCLQAIGATGWSPQRKT
jgi:hypothetical protein